MRLSVARRLQSQERSLYHRTTPGRLLCNGWTISGTSSIRSRQRRTTERRLNQTSPGQFYSQFQKCNSRNLKTYIGKCFEILNKQRSCPQHIPLLPICCEHMIQTMARRLAKEHVSEKKREIAMRAFTVLQNCKSLPQGKQAFSHIWKFFLSEFNWEHIEQTLRYVRNFKFNRFESGDDERGEKLRRTSLNLENQNLVASSTFSVIFEDIKKEALCSIQPANEQKQYIQKSAFDNITNASVFSFVGNDGDNKARIFWLWKLVEEWLKRAMNVSFGWCEKSVEEWLKRARNE